MSDMPVNQMTDPRRDQEIYHQGQISNRNHLVDAGIRSPVREEPD